jgi:hypothetical protein
LHPHSIIQVGQTLSEALQVGFADKRAWGQGRKNGCGTWEDGVIESANQNMYKQIFHSPGIPQHLPHVSSPHCPPTKCAEGQWWWATVPPSLTHPAGPDCHPALSSFPFNWTVRTKGRERVRNLGGVLPHVGEGEGLASGGRWAGQARVRW